MTPLVMLVPTRSRPASVARLVEAWTVTGALAAGAQLVFIADQDDQQWHGYQQAVAAAGQPQVRLVTMPHWMPMVRKLNLVASEVAAEGPYAVGFAGDDHVPRTPGWVGACVAGLEDLGTGIVYGDDGYQHENLPTWWVMSSDIVRALGRMVPAAVEHLYCDNAIKDLGVRADCLRYLPEVLVEHMNPYADGKAEMDAQYQRVNSRGQFARDGRTYKLWRQVDLPWQARAVRQLMAGGQ